MALDVKVNIDLAKTIGNLGFGYPLILSVGAAEDYTLCTSIDDVVEAGYIAGTDTYKAAALMLAQSHKPEKIAVCGIASVTAEALAGLSKEDWRQLVTVGTISSEALETIVTYIAATDNRVYFATCTDATGLADLGTSDRVIGFVHTDPLAVAALAGEASGMEAGSFTYKNLILKNVTAMDLTETQITAIHTAHGITVLEKAGDNVTSEGTVMSGQYTDIIDSADYIVQQITYYSQKALNNARKVRYDNNGIAILENVTVDVMKKAFNNGIIAADADGKPIFSVNYLKREDCATSDIEARKYIGGNFTFTLAGAIHEVEVNGEMEVA